MSIISSSWRPNKLVFIFLNIAISCLGFFRSVVFLKYMAFYELGMVSVFQTLILLIGLSQIGILNGAYRAYSGSKKYYRKAINNFTFSFFLLLTTLAFVILFAYSLFSFSKEALIFFLGTVAGIFSLITNYINNALLADSKIKEVNIINIVSNLLGFASLVLIAYHPLLGLLSFIIQPFAFIVISFILDRSLIPRKMHFSVNIFQLLLQLGFIPYLTSLFVYLNLQLERWSIVYFLGVEKFGHFYLAVAYASLFALFPNSINSLYFPRMVRAHSEGKPEEFNKLLKQYSYILFIYCILAAIATLWLSPLVIGMFFPQHQENLKYVYFILPGLMAITITNPYIVYFNASLNLRPLLFAYGASSIIITIAIMILYISDNISLENIAIADSIGNISICLLALILYFIKKSTRSSVFKQNV